MESLSAMPSDPLPLAGRWLDEAKMTGSHNPWAMALATAGPDGQPTCRYVLLKSFDVAEGFAVFYTNYDSRKAQQLDANGHAAAALYWPQAGRQLRLEGPVTRSPQDDSDAYFATRPRPSQLNAWASRQSVELPPAGLADTVAAVETRFPPGVAVPRPPGWGGYRLWLETIEFWIEGAARFHERVQYSRHLDSPGTARPNAGSWQHVRLQP